MANPLIFIRYTISHIENNSGERISLAASPLPGLVGSITVLNGSLNSKAAWSCCGQRDWLRVDHWLALLLLLVVAGMGYCSTLLGACRVDALPSTRGFALWEGNPETGTPIPL